MEAGGGWSEAGVRSTLTVTLTLRVNPSGGGSAAFEGGRGCGGGARESVEDGGSLWDKQGVVASETGVVALETAVVGLRANHAWLH